MSFARKSVHAGIAAYLAAMFGTLLFALIEMDFTGYGVGKVVLLMLIVTTGISAYRFTSNFLSAESLNSRTV
jgi:uncharacterized membrane protein YgaE (UPF0421/DUF939 family)